MKTRLRRTVKKYVIVFAICLAYLIFVLTFGWGIPCVFYEITGLMCPSCGVSRMFIAMSKLDFRTAFFCNPFLFITGPVIIFCIAYSDFRYVKYGSNSLGKASAILWIEIALAVLYGVLRNFF